jgi:hypothetical protein
MNEAEQRNREQATESDGKGRRREEGRAEGGRQGGIELLRKRRGSGAHTLPDRGAAKPEGSNTGIHFMLLKGYIFTIREDRPILTGQAPSLQLGGSGEATTPGTAGCE